jgi:mono/diheme cytochrome c family protein
MQRPTILLLLLTLFASTHVTAAPLPGPGAAPDFNRDVRPILAQHCFKCHGPDDKSREARLRLDLRDSALAPAKSGKHAITPGHLDKSELVARITATDEKKLMPPPEAKRPLSPAEINTLKNWIASGAEYQPHWAYVAPVRPAVPRVNSPQWVSNPIDAFVLARLEAEGLAPAPKADRYTLIRRVYLDLIGLPPTPAEVDAFVNNASPKAYEQLVDHLLASPHFGERWARRWLDLARYADTNGYEKDRPRSIYPYRDWVIKAFNDDMPFDQFTIEQIAGDMLPGATLSQRIATGFHRNTMLNEEGGIDPLEFRYYAMNDRVSTTATVWLGLTLGCAQCHTHKYDPIPQREYYQFMAMLDNTEEPTLDLPDEHVDAARRQIQQKIAAIEKQMLDHFPPPLREKRFRAWLDEQRAKTVNWTPLHPTRATSNLPLLTIEPDDAIFASGDSTKLDIYRVAFAAPDVKTIRAIRLDVLPDDRLPAHGPGRAYYEGPKGDFFLSEIHCKIAGRDVAFASATESYGKLGIGGGEAKAALCFDGVAHSGWSTADRPGEQHHAVFNLPAEANVTGPVEIELIFDRHYAAALGKFRVSVTDADHAVARDLPPDIEKLLAIPDEKLTDADRAALLRQFLAADPQLRAQHAEITRLRKSLPAYPTTLVMAERPAANRRITHIHHRGEFLQPTDPVEPGTLSFLHPLTGERNRLGFARWLVDPRNPLVARVTINRYWAAIFGKGLVRTADDFGYQGEPPSHPELLDWLAVEFVESRWSLKHMLKLIVTSSTYQQSSALTPQLLERDRDNRLLARGPRFRLDAELIRDNALRISGLLSPKIGGPSVFPPQPPAITTEGTYGKFDWKTSTGEDRYRRGLYTFSKRTAPFAMFNTFDAPSGESCAARREVSNTPLQALDLLNDPVFTEAAEALAKNAAEIPDMFRRCLARPPTPEELQQLTAYFEKQKSRFESGELNPKTFGSDSPSAAAKTTLARVLLNLDETVTKN